MKSTERHRTSPFPARGLRLGALAVVLIAWGHLRMPEAYGQTARPATSSFPKSLHADVADDDPEPPREIILSFRYSDVVSADVSARYVGRAIYVPVGELFSLLGIDWHLDSAGPLIRGFYLEESRAYILNVGAGHAQVGETSVDLPTDDVLVVDHDVFVLPDVLERVFGLRVLVDMDDLAVFVESSRMLPVELERYRERHRPLLVDPYRFVSPAPLAFDRWRKALGGGALDYDLSVQQSLEDTRLHLQTAVGAEVLGGDVAWQGQLGFADHIYADHDYVRWRYALDASPLLRQIRLGTLQADGLGPRSFRGLHVTNNPARPERLFGEYVVEGEAEPDWELELLMDDRLIDVTRVPASGRYRFNVPLMYGSSRLRVRAYGPSGEVRDIQRRLQVPFTMLPPGSVRYNVNVGVDAEQGGRLGQADIGIGLSKHLTVRMGGEYVERLYGRRARPYVAASSRLLRSFLASVYASPEGMHRFSLNALFPSQASFEIHHTRAERTARSILASDRIQTAAAAYLPFRVGRLPMSVRLSGTRTTYGGAVQYRVRTHVQAAVRSLQLNLMSEADISGSYRTTRLVPSLSYVWMRPPTALERLRGLMVGARARYDLGLHRLAGVELNAAHSVARDTRVQLFSRLGPAHSVGLRVTTTLPYARTTTDTQIRQGSAHITQTLRGSLLADPRTGTVQASDRPAVGRASAAMRLFVDRNANGHLDADEHVLEHSAVRLDRGSALSASREPGVTRVSDLLPYERYTARIDEGAIANPLWVPDRRSFSFIADPNAVKTIDVPLYAAGVVEGRLVDGHGRPYAASGLLVRIANVDDGSERVLRTFSDGSFYEMGLRPGAYEVHLDPSQLDARDLTLAPGRAHIVVEATENGDYIDGVHLAVAPRPTGRPDFARRSTAELPPADLATVEATPRLPLRPPPDRRPIDILPDRRVLPPGDVDVVLESQPVTVAPVARARRTAPSPRPARVAAPPADDLPAEPYVLPGRLKTAPPPWLLPLLLLVVALRLAFGRAIRRRSKAAEETAKRSERRSAA